jgi:preprotein translocase subunit SecE
MITRFVNYIKETRQELHKVNWPNRAQTIQSTLLVIVISLGVAFFLGFFDYIYRYLLKTFIF